jgi:hypothetical protein
MRVSTTDVSGRPDGICRWDVRVPKVNRATAGAAGGGMIAVAVAGVWEADTASAGCESVSGAGVDEGDGGTAMVS